MRIANLSLLIGLLAAGLAWSGATRADGVGICDNCTQIQMQEAATGVHTDNNTVHMLDFGQGIYRSYFVEVISEPGVSQTQVQQITTSPEAAEILQNTLDLANFLVQEKDVDVSQLPLPNPPGSAIDLGANFTQAGGVAHALELWLADSGTNGGIVAATTVLGRLTGLVSGNIITVRFPDGSRAELQITEITVNEQGNPVVKVTTKGLYQSNNQPVPTSSSELAGVEANINNQASMDRWTRLLRRLGVPIVEGTTPAQGGSVLPVRMECWIENGETICRFIYE